MINKGLQHTRGLDIHVTSTHTTSGSNHKGQVAFKLGCRCLIGLLLPTRKNHKGQVAFKLGCRRLIGLLLPTRINLLVGEGVKRILLFILLQTLLVGEGM